MKNLLAFTAVLLLCSTAFAQQSAFKAGLIAGVATTQIDGDGYAGWNKIGLMGGMFVNTKLSEKVTAEFQMTYIQKGSVNPTDPENGDFDYYRIRTNYVEVPLFFRFKGKKFFYDLGPSLGVLINSSEEDLNGPSPLLFHSFARTEVALQLGLGYKLTEKLHTNVRVAQSILPVSNEAVLTRWGIFGGSYHQMIVFAMRYQFIE